MIPAVSGDCHDLVSIIFPRLEGFMKPLLIMSPCFRWCPADSNGAPVTSYQLQMLMLGYGKQLLPAIDLDFCNDNENVTGSEIPSKLLDVTGSAAHRWPGDPSTLLAQGLPRSPSHSISSTLSRGTSSWESERPPASDAGNLMSTCHCLDNGLEAKFSVVF